jgi:hypothetical protein
MAPQDFAVGILPDESAAGSLSGFRGSSITNVVPAPGWLRTLIFPR